MIIGLCGEQGAGKDTVARIICETNPGRIQVVAFSDALRDLVYDSGAVVEVNGEITKVSTVVDSIGWDSAKRLVPEIRRVLQNVGGALRHEDPDHWAEAFLLEVPYYTHTIAPDVRYANEARVCDVLLRVDRPDNPHAQHGRAHASERSWKAFACEAVIVNDSSLELLQERVEQALHAAGVTLP